MDRRIPVTIFTGFLGSGKTTIISHLLSEWSDSKVAVLVNEFGEVSIDGATLRCFEDSRIKVIPLTTPLAGYGDDTELESTLRSVSNEKPRFEHVIIETSGLVVPTGIIEKLQGELKEDFVLDATVNLVDTPWFLAHGNKQPTDQQETVVQDVFKKQLDSADVVVLNKIDHLDHDLLHAAEHQLREISNSIRFLEPAFNGQINGKVALGLRLNQVVASVDARELVPVTAHAHKDGHQHSGLTEHDHGVHSHVHLHEHDPGWMSFTLHSHEVQSESRLIDALNWLARNKALMRFKGQAQTATDTAVALHGVRERLSVSPIAAANHSELVFIGYHLNREEVAAHLNATTSGDWH